MSRLLGRSIARVRGLVPLDFLLLTLLGVPAWQLLLTPGYPATHDGLFHLFRLEELDSLLRGGVVYPRLAPNLALGYDYPVFNYYPPASVYVAELFRLAGLGYIDAIKAALALSIVAAGWGMLLFARSVMPRPAAWLAAVAYAYLPYLLLDVYVRGALAEALALPLLPVCLWAAGRLATGVDPGRIALAGLATALLVLTHNVTAFMFLPVVAAYWLFRATLGKEARRSARAPPLVAGAAAAGLLCLALSAFYWVPALAERDLIASGRLTGEFFDFHEHFHPVTSLIQTSPAYDYRYDLDRRVYFRAGLVQVALAGLGCAAALWRGPGRREALFWGVVMVGALAGQTSRTAFVWEAVPLAAYVQFPWRLLALVGVASSVLAGHVLGVFGATTRHARLAWMVASLLAAGLVATALANLQSDRLAVGEAEVRPWTIQRIELDRGKVAATPGEYLPRWVGASLFDLRGLPLDEPNRAPARLTVREAGPFHLDLDVAAEEPTTVLFDRFYFLGWQAQVDDRPAVVWPEEPLGLLATEVPAGEHRLGVSFGSTPLRTTATATSALALLTLVGLTIGSSTALGRPDPRLARVAGNRPAFSLAIPSRVATGGLIGVALVAALTIVVATGRGQEARAAGPPGMLARSVATDFGPAIRLAGASLDHVGDGVVSLTLYWQALTRPVDDHVVALRLLDPGGRVVGERDKRPLFGLRPTGTWEAGQLVRDHQEIALRPGVPAGEYELVVGLVNSRTSHYVRPSCGQTAEWRDGPAPGAGLSLGRIRLESRAPADLPSLAHASDARFGDRIGLVGYELERLGPDGAKLPVGRGTDVVATIGQGERLRIRLRWRALGDVDEDYAVFTHLLDSRHQMLAQDDEWPHRGFYPTTLWLPGEEVLDEYVIRVPETAPLGRYDLSVGLYRRADQRRLRLAGATSGADRLSLGFVKIVPRPPLVASHLPVRRRVDAMLGDGLALLGYDLRLPGDGRSATADVKPRPSDRLTLTLYWQAERRQSQDYTVFVHLYDDHGVLRAQSDGPPANGGYPTTLWEVAEVVPDEHSLELPPDLPPGRYRLAVGLYLVQTGARLQLHSGDDKVMLEEVVVSSR